MITFRQFKKQVLNFFYKHSTLKKRIVKKALKFEQSSITHYCYFKFNNEDLCLCNCLSWSLVFAKPNDKGYILVCNIGKTLEECCDYLYSKVKGELELL